MNPKGNVHHGDVNQTRYSLSCVRRGPATQQWNRDRGVSQFYSKHSVWPLLRTVLQQVHDELVGGQHDGRVGDLPHELGEEASVEGEVALLAEHQARRLHEGLVLGALLPQPRPDHLCRNRSTGCAALLQSGLQAEQLHAGP